MCVKRAPSDFTVEVTFYGEVIFIETHHLPGTMISTSPLPCHLILFLHSPFEEWFSSGGDLAPQWAFDDVWRYLWFSH